MSYRDRDWSSKKRARREAYYVNKGHNSYFGNNGKYKSLHHERRHRDNKERMARVKDLDNWFMSYNKKNSGIIY